MTRRIHPVAGTLAQLTILTFWLSTALSELLGSEATITAVKTAIPWGFLLLVPALAAAGGSGFALAQGRRASKARNAEFDAAFYSVQAVELIAGAANITLLALNMRDGLRMTGRLRRCTL